MGEICDALSKHVGMDSAKGNFNFTCALFACESIQTSNKIDLFEESSGLCMVQRDV